MVLLNRSTLETPHGRTIDPVKNSPLHFLIRQVIALAGLTIFIGSDLSAQVDGPIYRPTSSPGRVSSQAPSIPNPGQAPVLTGQQRPQWAPLYQPTQTQGQGNYIPPPAYKPPVAAWPNDTPVRETPDQVAARGQIAAALAQNRALQSMDPKNVGLRIKEARYLSWLSRHYTAANRYRAILREHPNHADALTGYGTALFWQSNWREAENALTQSISLSNPADLAPHTSYFRVLAEQGRASEAYRQAMDLDRQTGYKDAPLGMVIAEMLAHIGLYADGLGYASRPTADHDLLIRQTEYHSRLVVQQHGKQAVEQLASDLVARHRGRYNAYVAAGDLLGDNGRLNEALNYYNQAVQMSSEREEAVLGRARIQRTRGHHADALQTFQAAVQANPESINGWIGVGEMARFQGDYPRAWQALETAHSVAPGSAMVFREKLKLAVAQQGVNRFSSILKQYRAAQPADPYTRLWELKWIAIHQGGVREEDLRGILDPMAPDLNTEALSLIEGRRAKAADAVPAAPTPNLDYAARRELKRRVHTRNPGSVNLTAGYEYSSLKATTILGGTFPEWHEAYFAGFWRRDGGPTLSWDYRHFERFSNTAQQLEGGILAPVSRRWLIGAKGGAALSGDFIPHWRAGGEINFLASQRWNWKLEYRHLRFTDTPVHQLIPEVTWNWSPKFSSTARLYVTHSRPKGAVRDTGFSGYFDIAYKVASNSHAKIHYAHGDENASALIRGLIGEKNFQSAGIELRLGINQRWAIIPGYRYERHNLFDLHPVSLALNGRF